MRRSIIRTVLAMGFVLSPMLSCQSHRNEIGINYVGVDNNARRVVIVKIIICDDGSYASREGKTWGTALLDDANVFSGTLPGVMKDRLFALKAKEPSAFSLVDGRPTFRVYADTGKQIIPGAVEETFGFVLERHQREK